MLFFHPRRYVRILKNRFYICQLKKQARKNGVELHIGQNVEIISCSLSTERRSYPNIKLIIEDGCFLNHAHFNYSGGNAVITIGRNTHATGMVTFQIGSNSSISIGKECLFASGVVLCTNDFHPVFNMNGKRINPNKSILIGEHVWFARYAFISKGVTIGKNSIVGAYSIVTKPFTKENIVIAGNPAAIKKENVYWEE